MLNYKLLTANDAPKDFGYVALNELMASFDYARAHPTLVLPTGGTPKSLYNEMRGNSAYFIEHEFQAINLDEYQGVEKNDPRSYAKEIFDAVLSPLGQDVNMNFMFNGLANPMAECARMDKAIEQAGGIDIAVLGIGSNGHIAFNEPNTSFDTRTHLVQLTDDTKRANAAYCDVHGGVPDAAFTLGLKTIFEAKKIILLSNKPEITAKALNGEVTENVPASILQNHKNLSVVATPEVARALTL